jgi:hypothetical protein
MVRRQQFGEVQLKALKRLNALPQSFDQLIRVAAKSYSGAYYLALRRAIEDHNLYLANNRHDTDCAKNCPIGERYVVIEYSGPRGGQRVRLDD